VHGVPVVSIGIAYTGDLEEGARVVAPLRRLATPVVDTVAPTPYVALERALDLSAPPGLLNLWRSAYLRALPDAAIEVLVEHAAAMPSPLSLVALHELGGAVARVPPDATAVAHRDAPFALAALSLWTSTMDDDERQVRWAVELGAAMAPYASGAPLAFLDDEGEDRVRAAYGRHHARLAAFKAERDPGNFFRSNHNIEPVPRKAAAS
jgi:hypothetical protein